MAVHSICTKGFRVANCSDEALHRDSTVKVVGCYAEHQRHHHRPYVRAVEVLQVHGLPVPANLAQLVAEAPEAGTESEAS